MAGRGELEWAASQDETTADVMGEEAAVRKAGRGQSKGVPPSRGCFLPPAMLQKAHTGSSERQLRVGPGKK